MRFSADGRSLTTCDEGGVVRVWDTATGRERLSRRVGRTCAVALSDDGCRVAWAAGDSVGVEAVGH